MLIMVTILWEYKYKCINWIIMDIIITDKDKNNLTKSWDYFYMKGKFKWTRKNLLKS